MKLVEDHPGKPVFPNRILERFPGLRSGKVWKEEHDKIMIRAVLKYESFTTIWFYSLVIFYLPSFFLEIFLGMGTDAGKLLLMTKGWGSKSLSAKN